MLFPRTNYPQRLSPGPIRRSCGALERLGGVAVADWEAMLGRCPHLVGWCGQAKVIPLAQGAAEHFVRSRRGIGDLDVIVWIINDPALPRLSRRQVVSWDWGPSKSVGAGTTLLSIPGALLT